MNCSMRSFRNYAQLQQYVMANPIPKMEIINSNYVMLNSEKTHIDFIALHHLPTDAPDGYAPLKINGDGNCFPRVCSYLVSKHEDRYDEFCVRIIYELVESKDMYLNNDYISKGTSIIHRRGSTVDQIAMFSKNYNPVQRLDTEKMYNLELLDICTSEAYIGMWQILAAANILTHPIQSVYPNVRQIVRPDLNRKVFCYDDEFNMKTLLHIMWTSMAVGSDDPCHFILLLKVVRKYYEIKYDNLQTFVNITKYFYFIFSEVLSFPPSRNSLKRKRNKLHKERN